MWISKKRFEELERLNEDLIAQVLRVCMNMRENKTLYITKAQGKDTSIQVKDALHQIINHLGFELEVTEAACKLVKAKKPQLGGNQNVDK